MLREQLRGSRCEAFSADTFVRIPGGNYRMPDAGIECGAPNGEQRWAGEPRLVGEVLSPSSREFDGSGKLDEYKSVPSITVVLLIEAEVAEVTLWSRAAGRWSVRTVAGLDASVDLAELGLSLPMAELYERVALPPRPVLVT